MTDKKTQNSTNNKKGLTALLEGFEQEENVFHFDEVNEEVKEQERVELNASILSVLVPVPGIPAYSYRVLEHESVSIGSIVEVPLGPRKVLGLVVDDKPSQCPDLKKLKSIEKVLPFPPLKPDMLSFLKWVSRYTMTAAGLTAKMALRGAGNLEKQPPLTGYQRTGKPLEKQTEARLKVLELFKNFEKLPQSEILKKTHVSKSVLDGLVKVGVLGKISLPPLPFVQKPNPDFSTRPLFKAQEKAAENLKKTVENGGFSVTLIDGVTGSGKTEVYFEAIAEALRKNVQVLILVPEISLTAAFLDRFKTRFGTRPLEWHSDMADKRRKRAWQAVISGEARVIVGARSALFLPFQNLGLVIVDEEHDMAYKQEERIYYHARDMAVVRGHCGNFPVILASATPSLETFINVEEGRYHSVHLPSRIDSSELPALKVINMRESGPEKEKWLAPQLVEALKETLEEGKQSLLFLNRRGYAPLTLCRQCGYRFQCPNCASWLVEHRFQNTLECHHCGLSLKKTNQCPNCESTESLIACGPGVERIYEEVQERFPEARNLILSSDMFSTAQKLKEELALVERGEADIIIGTQLVAKGHNFPNLAFVGVVDADLGLSQGDMRAAERTFQLLSQVTGRAGRAGGKSKAYLQSYCPEHAVIKALLAGNRNEFYKAEAKARKDADLPPYTRLVSFIISAKGKHEAISYGQHLRQNAPPDNRLMILGPSEAPLATLRGLYRMRLLIRAPKNINIQSYIENWLSNCQKPKGQTKLSIDIDPQSFW